MGYMGYIGVIWGMMEKKMETTIMGSMGGCQNDGPCVATLNIRCRTVIMIQKRDHNFDNHPYSPARVGCGVCGARIIIYPKPYSIYLRGTISFQNPCESAMRCLVSRRSNEPPAQVRDGHASRCIQKSLQIDLGFRV